ncbi:MAG: diguanylate cyclase [Acidobacteria bacterium]|nr:diguanylate cyclase [Acidobacteriota bacterium]MCH8268499.1 diguanylate cyclase [Acidobacteriota bacterium]
MEQESRIEAAEAGLREIQEKLRQAERRDWWLWLAAILVILLLTLAVLSFSLPSLSVGEDSFFRFNLQQGARGLLGLILLFCIYTIYQQTLVKRLRVQTAEHVAAQSQLAIQAERARRLAMLDPLTGIYNRRFLEQYMETELARSQRQGYQLTVLMLDLNDFKRINDQHGHPAGDLVLQEFTNRLKKAIRSSDMLVRMGGDEFLVLLPECSPEHVGHLLARLTGQEAEFRGQKIPVTFAAGWTSYQPGDSPAQLLDRADQALYSDKLTGRAKDAVREVQLHAQQLQKMETVGQLAGGIAHDFNNLLTLVKGYSELMLDRLGESDPLRRYVEQIHQTAERAGSLTRQLLAFSRKRQLATEAIDLNVLIAEMETMLQRLIGEQISIVSIPEKELGQVEAHRGQIEQVILNLAVNARDSMPQGGKLTLETANVEPYELDRSRSIDAQPGPYVMLAVTDTGVGMDEKTLGRIFEPFFTTKEKDRGTGLGLATVYGVVKQSGGSIWVDSTPGRGTTFTIYWPRAEKKTAADGPGESDAAPAGAVDAAADTILLVEETESIRPLTREVLEESGYGDRRSSPTAHAGRSEKQGE